MNKFIATGRLTRDSELRFTPDGTAILKFSVANNTGYGDKQKTHYIECALFGKRAESLAPYMLKGTQLAVEGELSLNTYQKKDGSTGASLSLRVGDLDLMGGKTESKPQANQDFDEIDASIPF